MSSADPAEVSMVVSRDGVTVDKSFEPDDFPVPAIAFVIRSERDELVSVRLVDEVPESVDPEDIGFHPKYGAEHWAVEDGMIAFEREFEAGEEYTTVYGLRASQTDDIESYMTQPELEDVDPPAEDSGQAVRDVIDDDRNGDGSSSDSDIEAALASTDAESDAEEPDAGSSDEDADDEAVEPLDLEDPNGDDEPDIPDAESDADSSDEDAAGEEEEEEEGAPTENSDESVADEAGADPAAEEVSADGDLVAALASQLRSGAVSDDDVEELQRALAASGGDGSTDARIVQLQSEVADLRAYTNALESFIDENGDARQLVEDAKESVERLESELSDVESRTDENASEVAAVADDIEEVANDLDSVESDVEAVADDVEAVDERVDEMAESLAAVEDLEDRLASLEDEFAESRDDLQSLSQMREQLSSVFGAQVDGPTGDQDGADGDDE